MHVMVGGERELEHKPSGPAIPRTQDKQKRRAQANNHPHTACAQTFTIVAKDDNQKNKLNKTKGVKTELAERRRSWVDEEEKHAL